MSDLEISVHELLAHLSDRVRRKDIAVMELFDDDAGIMLAGSEPGDLARGPIEVRAHMHQVFALPLHLHWEWDSIACWSNGDIAWFLADGRAVIARGDELSPVAYRLSGVLVKSEKGWRFRLFHGSEPRG